MIIIAVDISHYVHDFMHYHKSSFLSSPRCILAASSPVLASLLSSTGALVELQAPCLTDSVLALLLEYIYTGALPHTQNQQLYYSLLTAACHLQMDKLEEILKAWQQYEVNAVDNDPASAGAENQLYKTPNAVYGSMHTFRDLPPTPSTDAFRRLEERDTSSMQSTTSSPERATHQYSSSAETCDEGQTHSPSIDSSSKDAEISACRNSSKTCTTHCSRTNAGAFNNARSCSSILESTGSNVNARDCRQVTLLTPKDSIKNIPTTAEVHDMFGEDKEVQKDPFHLDGIIKPEIWHKGTREVLVRSIQDRRSSSTSSSSSPPPCCEAVPVICHSSRAAILQLTEESAGPLNHPASQALVTSSKASVSQSAAIDNADTFEAITTKHKNYYGAKNPDFRHSDNHLVTKSRDDMDQGLNQSPTEDSHHRFSADRYDVLQRDHNRSNTEQCIIQYNGHVANGYSHITDHNDQQAHCDSFQGSPNHLRGDSLAQNKHQLSKGLNHQSDLSFENCPSNHKCPDCLECYNKSAAADNHSQDVKAEVPLPLRDSNTGSNSHCDYICTQAEANEEHSHCNGCPDEKDTQDSQYNLYKTSWYPHMCQAETSTKRSRHDYDSNDVHTAMENQEHHIDLSLPFSTTAESSLYNGTGCLSAFECRTSPEPEKISGIEIPEPLTSTPPVDSVMSDTTYSAVGQSYHGHLHYHCLSQEDLAHGGPDLKFSQPRHSESSDEEEVGTFASPSQSPLKQHFATETTDQVVLLNISTKPAELLVSCKRDMSATGIPKQAMKTTRVQAESGDEPETVSLFGQTHAERKKQSRAGGQVIKKAGEVVSNPKEGEHQISTWTVCSSPSVPDSVQASVSSTLSVCIPSTLSASMPTNISAHLSTPVHHPFQCSLCDRSFSQRGSLNRHVRSHLGVRPFPCPHCPMTFSRQYRVTEHMRVHQRCSLGNTFRKPPPSSV